MENDVKSLLRRSGFSFKKKYGQNFITDEDLLENIVALSDCTKEDDVVEIGCGAGTLTRVLSRSAKSVTAFEVDHSLKDILAVTLGGCENTEVRFLDFLKLNLAEFEEGFDSYKIVANLPYYITSPLIMKIIDESKKCKSLTVMVQEEVADRLCGQAGTAEYGAITAAVALRASSQKVLRVPRTSFFPQPNVDSAVVRLDIVKKRIAVDCVSDYKKTVRAAFLSRRKTLANNLMAAFKMTREEAERVLLETGIDLKARGETLTPEQLADLSNRIFSKN